MDVSNALRILWVALPGVLFSPAGWAQDNPYIYVRMPLTVPWTLYFIFLGAVLIPFVVMIALAWRRHTPDRSDGAAMPRRGRDEADG